MCAYKYAILPTTADKEHADYLARELERVSGEIAMLEEIKARPRGDDAEEGEDAPPARAFKYQRVLSDLTNFKQLLLSKRAALSAGPLSSHHDADTTCQISEEEAGAVCHYRHVQTSANMRAAKRQLLRPSLKASSPSGGDGKSGAAAPSNVKETCADCGGVGLRNVPAKCMMVCPSCGKVTRYIDVTLQALPYGKEMDVSKFSYKRSSHFNDWLDQIQGKEYVTVPEEVCQRVRAQLENDGVDCSRVSASVIKATLKSMGLQKLYDNVSQITAIITGKTTPRLSSKVEAQCRVMFSAIQAPFSKHCPSDRKNFLSYPYCLYKFLQLLNQDEILDSFVLLKGRDKLYAQDEIFRKICAELNWEFVPTV